MCRTTIHAVALVVVVVTIAGCGGPFDSTAKGVVTLDGTALPSGWVTFYPTAGGPPAYGRIDESGSYFMQTGRSTGLPAGEYQVTVIANEPPKELRAKDGGPPPPGKQITPAWYCTKDKSGLSVTVKPGRNTLDLELTSKPPAGWNAGGQKRT
jgi:hypothetical protein